MSAAKDLLRVESDGSLSFGDYTLEKKTKLDNFEFQGNIYKVKTSQELTKLEMDGMFVYESVPGTSVEKMKRGENEISFSVRAASDAQFTLGVEPECVYEIFLNGVSAGKMETNLSGKLSVSVELSDGERSEVKVVKG
jgi:hypothetical protein